MQNDFWNYKISVKFPSKVWSSYCKTSWYVNLFKYQHFLWKWLQLWFLQDEYFLAAFHSFFCANKCFLQDEYFFGGFLLFFVLILFPTRWVFFRRFPPHLFFSSFSFEWVWCMNAHFLNFLNYGSFIRPLRHSFKDLYIKLAF